MAILAIDQMTLTDLTDTVSVELSTQSIALSSTNTTKLNTATTKSIIVGAYAGSTQIPVVANDISVVDDSGTATSLPSYVSITKTQSLNEVVLSVQFAADLAVGGEFNLQINVTNGANVLSYIKKITYSLSLKGATGASARRYILGLSNTAVIRNAAKTTISPSSITATSKYADGTGSPTNYSGRFKIVGVPATGSETALYTSSSNEASKSFTVTSAYFDSYVALRFELYLAGGVTTLLDSQTVPLLQEAKDGTNGSPGAAGTSSTIVIIDNEAHNFSGGTTSAVATTLEIGVDGYVGATKTATNVGTITGAVTGISAAVKSNTNNTTATKITITVTTSLTTKSGKFTIPVTCNGITFTKTFSWSLTLSGANGDDAIVLSVTSSAGLVFKNTGVTTTLTAHVYRGGAELTDTQVAALGTIRWYKDGSSTPLSTTGKTLDVTSADVTNTASFIAQLES